MSIKREKRLFKFHPALPRRGAAERCLQEGILDIKGQLKGRTSCDVMRGAVRPIRPTSK